MTQDPINARGTFTPLGVSRSSDHVAGAVSDILKRYVVMEDLKRHVDDALSDWSGAEAGTVVHCAASAITLTIAATMTGTDMDLVKALPLPTGGPNSVLLPACHNVNYGHEVSQAIRLSGAQPMLVGENDACSIDALEAALKQSNICALLLVHSRLVKGETPSLGTMVNLAKRYHVPVIIDGAAQDFKIEALMALTPDLLLISGQKYLASPTAGLLVGTRTMVDAVRAQESGIGRGMKATKEAIAGTLAALHDRRHLDMAQWAQEKADKLAAFLDRANRLPGVVARAIDDPTGLPFQRASLCLNIDPTPVIAALKAGSPPIWVMEDRAPDGEIILESVALTVAEENLILDRLASLLR